MTLDADKFYGFFEFLKTRDPKEVEDKYTMYLILREKTYYRSASYLLVGAGNPRHVCMSIPFSTKEIFDMPEV